MHARHKANVCMSCDVQQHPSKHVRFGRCHHAIDTDLLDDYMAVAGLVDEVHCLQHGGGGHAPIQGQLIVHGRVLIRNAIARVAQGYDTKGGAPGMSNC